MSNNGSLVAVGADPSATSTAAAAAGGTIQVAGRGSPASHRVQPLHKLAAATEPETRAEHPVVAAMAVGQFQYARSTGATVAVGDVGDASPSSVQQQAARYSTSGASTDSGHDAVASPVTATFLAQVSKVSSSDSSSPKSCVPAPVTVPPPRDALHVTSDPCDDERKELSPGANAAEFERLTQELSMLVSVAGRAGIDTIGAGAGAGVPSAAVWGIHDDDTVVNGPGAKRIPRSSPSRNPSRLTIAPPSGSPTAADLHRRRLSSLAPSISAGESGVMSPGVPAAGAVSPMWGVPTPGGGMSARSRGDPHKAMYVFNFDGTDDATAGDDGRSTSNSLSASGSLGGTRASSASDHNARTRTLSLWTEVSSSPSEGSCGSGLVPDGGSSSGNTGGEHPHRVFASSRGFSVGMSPPPRTPLLHHSDAIELADAITSGFTVTHDGAVADDPAPLSRLTAAPPMSMSQADLLHHQEATSWRGSGSGSDCGGSACAASRSSSPRNLDHNYSLRRSTSSGSDFQPAAPVRATAAVPADSRPSRPQSRQRRASPVSSLGDTDESGDTLTSLGAVAVGAAEPSGVTAGPVPRFTTSSGSPPKPRLRVSPPKPRLKPSPPLANAQDKQFGSRLTAGTGSSMTLASGSAAGSHASGLSAPSSRFRMLAGSGGESRASASSATGTSWPHGTSFSSGVASVGDGHSPPSRFAPQLAQVAHEHEDGSDSDDWGDDDDEEECHLINLEWDTIQSHQDAVLRKYAEESPPATTLALSGEMVEHLKPGSASTVATSRIPAAAPRRS